MRASEVLALDPVVLAGGSVELQDRAPLAQQAGTVGMLTIDGPLAQRAVDDLCAYVDGYDAIAKRFADLCASDVDGIVIRICSPGGDAAGIEVAIASMRSERDRRGMPVAVYVDELAASAAYWLAAALATDGIYLPQAGSVGSIGCISALVDMTGALEQDGLKVELVRVPAGKAEAHPYGPVTELAQQRAHARVEAFARRFFAAVGAARGLGVGEVEELNGEVLTGEAAVRAGLADGVVSGIGAVVDDMAARARRRTSMEQLRAVYGLGAEATEADIAAAARAQAAKVVALEAERERDLAELAQAREMIAQVAVDRAAAERAERVELVARLVKAGYETPATAWAEPGSSTLEPRGTLASMPIAELRERVRAFEAAPRAAAKPAAAQSPTGLTAEEIALCAQRGVDPARYAAIKTETLSKAARAAEA